MIGRMSMEARGGRWQRRQVSAKATPKRQEPTKRCGRCINQKKPTVVMKNMMPSRNEHTKRDIEQLVAAR